MYCIVKHYLYIYIYILYYIILSYIVLYCETLLIYPSRCIFFRLCQFTCSGLIAILIQAQVMILWGILDTSTKFLSTVRVWIGSIVELLIFKINIFKIRPFIYPSRCIFCNCVVLYYYII